MEHLVSIQSQNICGKHVLAVDDNFLVLSAKGHIGITFVVCVFGCICGQNLDVDPKHERSLNLHIFVDIYCSWTQR